MVDVKSLDKRCQQILVCLAMNKEMGFNQLYRTLEKMNYDITKPTLSRHLDHLIEQKILVKKKVGKQRINYKIVDWNVDKPALDNKELSEMREFIDNHIKGHELFKLLSAEDKANIVTLVIMITSLEQLEVAVSSILNPENAFSRQLELLIMVRILGDYKSWLLQECRENKKEVGKQLLQALISRQNRFFEEISKFNC